MTNRKIRPTAWWTENTNKVAWHSGGQTQRPLMQASNLETYITGINTQCQSHMVYVRRAGKARLESVACASPDQISLNYSHNSQGSPQPCLVSKKQNSLSLVAPLHPTKVITTIQKDMQITCFAAPLHTISSRHIKKAKCVKLLEWVQWDTFHTMGR